VKSFYSLNQQKLSVIRFLRRKTREKNADIWLVVAEFLQKSKRSHVAVNISKINRFTRDMLVTVGNINNSARYINKQGYATGNSMTMMRLVDWLQKKPRPNVYSYLIKWKE